MEEKFRQMKGDRFEKHIVSLSLHHSVFVRLLLAFFFNTVFYFFTLLFLF